MDLTEFERPLATIRVGVGLPETVEVRVMTGKIGSLPYFSVLGRAPKRGGGWTAEGDHYIGTLELSNSVVREERVGISNRFKRHVEGGALKPKSVSIGSSGSIVYYQSWALLETVAQKLDSDAALRAKVRKFATEMHQWAVKRAKG